MEVSVSFLKDGSYKNYIKEINKTEADYIHFDVMDGKFVSNKNLPLKELLELLYISDKRNDVHLMVKNPDKYIDKLCLYDIEYLTIHSEIDDANLLIEKITSKKTKGTVYIKLDNNLFTLATQTQLSMLCEISSGIGGKLFSILRDDGLVYSTQMYYEKGQNHLALAIDFACSADNVNKIIFNIGKLFEEYRTQPFDESLLSKKKENALIRKDESVDDIYTNRLFTAYTFNGKETLTKRYIKERKKLFQNITPDDMHNLCKNIFSKPENIYVALQTDAKPDSFYTYEQMQKLLTKKPRQMKIKSKGSKIRSYMPNTNASFNSFTLSFSKIKITCIFLSLTLNIKSLKLYLFGCNVAIRVVACFSSNT